tara:strand:- start:399 stop:932 length:534 start_codon:yes stop_codon:yes gene_type:complete
VTRVELEHAIRTACAIAEDLEVYVIGSQAILGQYQNANESLRQSVDADIVPKNKPKNADAIDDEIGEFSIFHQTHGFYVHGLPLEAATLPIGWEERCFKLQNKNTNQCIGWCLEGHDLAISKLVAFREKDREFVRTLVKEHLVNKTTLLQRVEQLPVEITLQLQLYDWIQRTCSELK